MSTAIKGLKPELLWKNFARISEIPRCSKNEEAVRRFILDRAARLGLEAESDTIGNVLVRKPASAKRRRTRLVALQCHLDMVCEKNENKEHNFMEDPIRLVRKDDFLMAKGTTLGADNGIAVAANLAIMEDDSLEHGPLELLFTVDEETGMTGALNLDPKFVNSRTLLNLDSEEEGALYVGCAGGMDTIGAWKTTYEDVPEGYIPGQLKVTGLKGGHSGLEIDRGRGNAIKILNRALMAVDTAGGRIISIDGGNKHNAIPRECVARLFFPEDKVEFAEIITGEIFSAVSRELSDADPDFTIDCMADFSGSKDRKALKRAFQKKILRVLAALPHGVVKVSGDIAGLVETSTNVAVIQTGADTLSIATSQRSSLNSELVEIAGAVSAVFALGGASVQVTDGYPGWKPDMESSILKTARSAYRSLYGKSVRVKAIHAGLECGVIGGRIPGMDMVSFGPTIEGAHSPDERVHIPSVLKFWEFLLAVLKRIR